MCAWHEAVEHKGKYVITICDDIERCNEYVITICDVKTIGKHINNALQEELAPVVAKFAPTQNGNPTVAKNATLQSGIQAVAKNATPYENPTVAKFAIVQQEGDRSVVRQVEYYSLDVILSVGYRVKSPRGIEFRRWANNVLKEYVLRGYAVNQRLLAIEDRMDRKFSAIESELREQKEKIDFFVRVELPPAEQIVQRTTLEDKLNCKNPKLGRL